MVFKLYLIYIIQNHNSYLNVNNLNKFHILNFLRLIINSISFYQQLNFNQMISP